MSGALNPGVTAITTVGNGVLTAAALLSGNIERSGPVGVYTDTTDTAANIIAALGPQGGFNGSWEVTLVNNVASVENLAAGVGVTLVTTYASASIPANSVAGLLVAVTASGPGVTAAVTVTVLYRATAT